MAVPFIGDTVTFGDVTFTFVDAPVLPTDVDIGETTAESAANLADACIALIGDDQNNPIFRSAIYTASDAAVRTFRSDETTTYYATTFTASTSSGGRITLSSATPATIADPAPYYDQGLGATIGDNRGSYGWSDFVIRDSQIFGTQSPQKYGRQAIRADKNWILETAGGAFYIDGLAGNLARVLQGHRYINVRFQANYDPFCVRLGRTNQDTFIGGIWDSSGTTEYKNPDGSSVGTTLINFKYGPTTRVPGQTKRTRFFGRTSKPYDEYCDMSDIGCANVADQYGGADFAGALNVKRGNISVDKSALSAGAAVYNAKGGLAGSSRYEFSNASGIQGGLRYYYESGNLRLACSGNLNTVLWNRDATFATQTLTPDIGGTGVYASGGAMRLTAGVGDVDIRAATLGNMQLRSGTSIMLSLTGDMSDASIRMPFRPALHNAFDNGISGHGWRDTYTNSVRTGTGTTLETSGIGTPEGVITAVVGSMFRRIDGAAGTRLYWKNTGTGNTGWVAIL